MEPIQLGGNIELTGFSGFNGGQMIIVKKIVGSYGRKFSDALPKFEKLSLAATTVDNTESKSIYEIKGAIVENSNQITAEASNSNLFMALDAVLKKLESSLN